MQGLDKGCTPPKSPSSTSKSIQALQKHLAPWQHDACDVSKAAKKDTGQQRSSWFIVGHELSSFMYSVENSWFDMVSSAGGHMPVSLPFIYIYIYT